MIRLHWICCCFKHVIIHEVTQLNTRIPNASNTDQNNDNNNCPGSELGSELGSDLGSDLETTHVSIKAEKIEMPQLSFATTMDH